MTAQLTAVEPTASVETPVVFDEVAPGNWRVLHPDLPSTSADALLGFVCRTAGVYEVTTMADPLSVAFFADLGAVPSAFRH